MENPEGITPDQGVYLYCFFAGAPSLAPEPGIDASSRTFALSQGDICALVSRVPLSEYDEKAINTRIRDVTWLAARVKRHEEIIRAAMGFHPVIPVKFGTLYTSEERVLQVLRQAYEVCRTCFEFIRGKEEWGVKVYAGDKAVYSVGANTKESIRGRDSSATPGEAYLLRRKRERLLQQEAHRLLDHLAEEIYQEIFAWPVEGKRNSCLSQRATGKTCDMILNAAFLIEQPEVESFKQRIDALAARHARTDLFFEISGPWPPYNFCPNIDAYQEEDRW